MYVTLKELRETKQLTQFLAAQVAGVSLESYKNHELGRSTADSPLGRMIYERIESFERYSFDRGILPLETIRSALADVFVDKDIDFAYLFGSYAKGTMHEKSDVDLLIFGGITGLDYFSLGGKLERALHKRVDVLRFDDIASNKELLREIMATGVRIYYKNER